MSIQSRDSEAEGARGAGAVQEAGAVQAVEERRPSRQVAAAEEEEERRSARQLGEEEEEAVAAHSRMAVAEEERPGRWLQVMEVAEAHLLLARAAGAAQRKPAVVVPGERWRLVAEEVLPGFSQGGPGQVGRSEEEEAARPIRGFSEGVVAAVLAGQRSSLATGAEGARHHGSAVEEERFSGPGMPEGRRICGPVPLCLRQETLLVAEEGEGRGQEPWLSRRARASQRREAVAEPGTGA